MNQRPEALEKEQEKQSNETEPPVSSVEYQRLLLAYQSVRQERDMLRKALLVLQLSRAY